MQESVDSIQMAWSVCMFFFYTLRVVALSILKTSKNDLGFFYTVIQVPSKINWKELPQTYEMAEKCLTTNYYGAKETTEAFIPLLQLSNLPMIVNVSSEAGLLKVPK